MKYTFLFRVIWSWCIVNGSLYHVINGINFEFNYSIELFNWRCVQKRRVCDTHQRAIAKNQEFLCVSAFLECVGGMMRPLQKASKHRSLRSRRRFPSWLYSPATRHSVYPKSCNINHDNKFLWNHYPLVKYSRFIYSETYLILLIEKIVRFVNIFCT